METAVKQLSKREIIDETANSFTSKNRAIKENSKGGNECFYTDINGNHCGVGRCMTKEGLEHLGYRSISARSINSVYHNGLDGFLKPEYRGHSIEFWEDIQSFHDSCQNWNENGLTEVGRWTYRSLMNRHGNK